MASYSDPHVGSFISSFPNDYGYRNPLGNAYNDMNSDNAVEDNEKPRILLMGMRRSGKSSIQKVVFHKMSPNETLFLESTNKIMKDDVSNCSFIKFQIWDFPGQVDFFDPVFDFERIFGASCAIIFVIDAQDDYMEALSKLHQTIIRAYKCNSLIKFEVFIHKVDCLNDDQKIEVQRDIIQRANDDLIDAGLDSISIGFHLTTIYDHSIFECFSKVVQKLIPYLAAFENLLNIFISNSVLEKAFLFDVSSKIYLATDSNPVDMQTYELCCDMIDVVVDMTSIYNSVIDSDSSFSEDTHSLIKLDNDTVLYLRGINKYLALVGLMREEALEKLGLIDYNFNCVKLGFKEILEIKSKSID